MASNVTYCIIILYYCIITLSYQILPGTRELGGARGGAAMQFGF